MMQFALYTLHYLLLSHLSETERFMFMDDIYTSKSARII